MSGDINLLLFNLSEAHKYILNLSRDTYTPGHVDITLWCGCCYWWEELCLVSDGCLKWIRNKKRCEELIKNDENVFFDIYVIQYVCGRAGLLANNRKAKVITGRALSVIILNFQPGFGHFFKKYGTSLQYV